MLIAQHGVAQYSSGVVVDNRFIFEVTTSGSITLPHYSGYDYDYDVDYGDGTGTFHVSSYNDPNASHTYTTGGVHQIIIDGLCETFCVDWNGFNNYLTKIVQWGNTGFRRMNLTGCYYNQQIPDDLVGGFAKITDFSQAFYYNYDSRITSIPENLFKYATGATNFSYVFYYVPYLTSIPENLFKYNTLASNFTQAFTYNYSSSMTSIPENLFKYNTQAQSFQNTFGNWNYLTTVPEDLFKYNTLVQDFSNCFTYCGGLSTVPAGLFRNCTSAWNFQQTFLGSGIYEVPEGLFSGCTSASYFYRTFYQCSSYYGVAPSLWLQFPSATGTDCFKQTYASNMSAIPEDWGGPIVKMRMELYSNTAPFTITLPHLSGYSYNYFVEWGDGYSDYVTSYNDPNATHVYNSVGSITMKISGLCETFFIQNGDLLQSKVRNINAWGDIGIRRMNFSGCTILQSIPNDSGGGLASMEDFSHAFAYCTGITSAAPNFWVQYSAITGTNCFTGDTNLYNYNYIPASWGGLGGTATPMKLEVAIPYDNFTLYIPCRSQNSDGTYQYKYDYYVDWGDGTAITHVTDYYSGYHTYPTGYTSYVMQISGICETFDCWQGNNAYPMMQSLKKLLQWGQLESVILNFMQCQQMTAIEATDGKGASLITEWTYGFYYCTALTGITGTMFTGCTRALQFQYLFYYCSALLSIPATIFDGCLNAYYFYGTFYGCSALTGAAPELWLRTTPYPAPQDGQCFAGATGLSNYADAAAAGWG